jgi:RNA polymerase sigma-70 factor (ECF subfamily)
VDPLAPDVIYEKRWALTLLHRVLGVLRQECEAAGKSALFEHLKGCLWGDERAAPYSQIAQRTNLSEGAVKVAAFRLRQRYRDLLRAEVAQTVVRPEEVDEELRHLIEVMKR